METPRNGSANGRATLADIHDNKQRISGLMDLNATRDQLERVKQQLSDEKNAKELYRDVIAEINRMVAGPGWMEPGEVKAAVKRRLDRSSDVRVRELEAQLTKQQETERQLQAGMLSEKKRGDQFRTKLHALQDEFGRLGDKYNAQEQELQRIGRMQVAAAPPATSISDEERDALLSVIDMERADHSQIMRLILQAAADAVTEVQAGLLSEKNSARGLKAQNTGLKLGAAAVEAAIGRVIHGITPKEKIER